MESFHLVRLVSLNSYAQAIPLIMQLEYAGIPLYVKNQTLPRIFHSRSDIMNELAGPVTIEVSSHRADEAENLLKEYYSVDMANIPEDCPACFAKADPARADCPACGLFLG